jgi:Domain of Unknown Function with PDB structure (DUF3857)/Transglutaminase-like superfamily
MLRTMWKLPRNLTRLAPPIPIDSSMTAGIADAEVSHWGQYAVVEDFVTVLHRDGTPSYRRRWVRVLHSLKHMEFWERVKYRFDRRTCKFRIRRPQLTLPDGRSLRATVTNRAFDQWGYGRLVEVVFAPLVPGVVVEMEDQQDNFTPFAECPGVWGDYLLQSAYPCRRRRIVVAVSQPFSARFELHNGAPAPVERQVGDYRVWSWDLNNIPGIETDEVTPPPHEFVPWVDFTTVPSWNPIARFYFDELKLPKYHDLKDLTATVLNSSLPDNGDVEHRKLAAAYSFAARDIRYGRPKDESEDRAIRPLGMVAEELRGDCKDKSALLVALLTELKIDARVVLVRTAEGGRVNLLPGSRFNHALVLAKLDGKEVWLDPASAAYSLGQLPLFDQGIQALILDRREPQPTTIPPPIPADHRLECVVRGRLDKHGSYRAEARVLVRGDCAAGWRWGLIERNSTTRERVMRQFVGGLFPSSEITDLKVEYLNDLNGDLTISHRATMGRFTQRIQDLLLVRIPWMERVRDNGFFAAPSRPQPLIVPVHSVSDRHIIELPPDFSGYGLPLERAELCDWGSYRCRVQIENGVLHCERDLELRGGNVHPERFEEMRRFTQACIDGDASDIVLLDGELRNPSKLPPTE